MVMGARCVWLVFFSIRDPTSLEAAGVRSDIGAAKFYIQDIAQQFQAEWGVANNAAPVHDRRQQQRRQR
jgi:hypothetical protein